ncbi:unnamed protein product [Clonostachys solani]|uniref:Secreted protein n=1 Tax=Clonostachys solani TaxID=160281 RepID=A0A9N9Z2H2_9HYPO|nr:unnamed protein product [Clonostachys solani]
MVVLANTPHLLLSILYYSFNTLFAAMCASTEWADFGASPRKTLRSSKPSGSYFLQLRYRFSTLLLGLSTVLHRLTSQALFLAKVEGTDSHGAGMRDSRPPMPTQTSP